MPYAEPQTETLEEIAKLRSRIPGNHALRQAAFCLKVAEKARKRGDKSRERVALSWANEFQREHNEHEKSDRLIHYSAVPKGVCDRKDSNADGRSRTVKETGTTITEMASASHLENVDCLICRRWARNNPRRTWRCEHGVFLTNRCRKCALDHDRFISSTIQAIREGKVNNEPE